MDFYQEESVKIYRVDSPTARVWGFFARCLMHELVRHANRAGVLYLPEEISDPHVATASVIGCPDVAWIREHLPKLIEHGAIEHSQNTLVVTRYHEAQYCGIDPNVSSVLSKRKRRETQGAIEEGLIEPPAWWKPLEVLAEDTG